MKSSRRIMSGALVCALAAVLFSAGTGSAHGRHSHFHGSGTWSASAPTSCTMGSSAQCYTASGSLTVNNNAPVTFTGNGMFDPSTCKTRRTSTCCINTMIGQFATPDGNIDFSFGGKGCQLSSGEQTLKGPMKLSGVSGSLTGFSGAGHLSGELPSGAGSTGPITITGAIHQ